MGRFCRLFGWMITFNVYILRGDSAFTGRNWILFLSTDNIRLPALTTSVTRGASSVVITQWVVQYSTAVVAAAATGRNYDALFDAYCTISSPPGWEGGGRGGIDEAPSGVLAIRSMRRSSCRCQRRSTNAHGRPAVRWKRRKRVVGPGRGES